MEAMTMEDLFRSYWWLLFPLAWFVSAGFSSLMSYRRQKDALNLIKYYADKGQEPPAAVLDILGRPASVEDHMWGTSTSGSTSGSSSNPWSTFGLFVVLCGGFVGAHYYTGMDGGTGAFLIVAFVMGAMAIWSLINALTSRRGRDRDR
tara:strand:- start:41 stop:484 length:444 start_codon:yes stop_codon:yes gene_type:complete